MASGVMMRINATVEYGVQRRRIVVPCGDGRKSVKWLGLVAAQRFIMDAAARGKTRLRDRRSVAPAATYVGRRPGYKFTAGARLSLIHI